MDANEISAAAEMRQFCESVSESTTKNIRLLKAIEQTVKWLTWIQDRAKADSTFALHAAEHLKTCERKKAIDEDGTLCALFEEVEVGLHGLHELLIIKRHSARKAPELVGDDKSAVVDEYIAAIDAIADLHNFMVDLRWAVGEHDADLEQPTGKTFSKPEDLKTYLASL